MPVMTGQFDLKLRPVFLKDLVEQCWSQVPVVGQGHKFVEGCDQEILSHMSFTSSFWGQVQNVL